MSVVQLSEMKKDNTYFRLDSEYFKKQYLYFFANVFNLKPLEYFVEKGYRVVYENTEILDSVIARNNNYPIFLQATNLITPFIDKSNLFYVHEKDWLRYPKGRIEAGEILIEVKGKIEKVAIVPEDFPKKVLVSGSLYKMKTNNHIDKYYLLSYLVSKYGEAFKNRYKTNLLISFLSKDDLYRIPVPNFSKRFQKQFSFLFDKIFESQYQSQSLYTSAESLLLESLNLQNFQPSSKKTNIKSFKESFGATGRLDAEYYQTKYEEIKFKILASSSKLVTISDCFNQNKTKIELNKQGFNYIEIGDINVVNGQITYNYVPVENLPDNAKIKLNKGDLLISKVRPNRGAVAIVDFEIENLVGSGAFTVLQERKNSPIKKEILKILLCTPLYRELLLQPNVGTSYPVIRDEDILQLPIPTINSSIQSRIADLIHQSTTLRTQSQNLLTLAKQAVEVAIEQGEEAGLRLLQNI